MQPRNYIQLGGIVFPPTLLALPRIQPFIEVIQLQMHDGPSAHCPTQHPRCMLQPFPPLDLGLPAPPSTLLERLALPTPPSALLERLERDPSLELPFQQRLG